MLVLLLFTLNLTVTDGDINGFILYVNIISINSHVFFPLNNFIQPSYIFVSIANLDLGIETCFYNGMDDYAKMWLQLIFPTYLIFIATSLIMQVVTQPEYKGSQHTEPYQYLLHSSYCPILRSFVLFQVSYSITLLSLTCPVKKYIDANVPLFGVRFTVLFVVSLVLFLMLLHFSVVLIFTKTLSRFKLINHFKPLIDGFQGPHKYKCYY